MAVVKFGKYQAAGDNFIFLDNREGIYDDITSNIELKKKMCDRNFGIGANGIIEIRSHDKYPFEMIFHGSNGFASGMCGNGGRISLRYATITAGLVEDNKEIRFHVKDVGEYAGRFDVANECGHLNMRDIAKVHKISDTMYVADSGRPHLVVFSDDSLQNIDVVKEGSELSELWKQYGTVGNPLFVNFVREINQGLQARCYDAYGVEEIASCGTATTAIAVCHAVKTADNAVDKEDGEKTICWTGGELVVKFHRENTSFSKLQLIGPARHVFSGTYTVTQ